MKADLHIERHFYWVGDGEPLPNELCLKGLALPFEVYYDKHLIGRCRGWPELDTPKLSDPLAPAPEFGQTILRVELDLDRLVNARDAFALLQRAWWAMRSCDEPDGDLVRTSIAERFPEVRKDLVRTSIAERFPGEGSP